LALKDRLDAHIEEPLSYRVTLDTWITKSSLIIYPGSCLGEKERSAKVDPEAAIDSDTENDVFSVKTRHEGALLSIRNGTNRPHFILSIH